MPLSILEDEYTRLFSVTDLVSDEFWVAAICDFDSRKIVGVDVVFEEMAFAVGVNKDP